MRPGKKTRPRGADNSYWTSYSDMMAGMLFVFALILFAAVYQLVDLQQKKTIELQTKEAQLSTQQSLLIDQEAELKDKEELLAATTLALQQQQEELEKRADNRISQVELYHEGEYRRISQELSEKFDAAVMALNKSFEERHEQIETEIFNRIVGE